MPTPSLTVHFARPPGTPLGDLMNEIRSWLDSNWIQPVEFRSTVSEREIGFSIRFRGEAQASLFERAFP